MQARKAPDTQAVGLMLLFCLILGGQQVLLKAAADDVAPVLQIAIRSGIGAFLVWLYMRVQGERPERASGNWKPGLWVGLLFAAEYLFLGEALRFTSASRAVVFLYTAPIFAAVLLHFMLPSERMNRVQCLGTALAFGGTALAFLGNGEQSGAGDKALLGDTLALLAGAAWGATTVVIRGTRLGDISPRETLLYQLLMAFVVLSIASVVLGQTHFVASTIALGSLAFQSVVVALAAFLIWFWLLRHYQAAPIGILSFMTPVFGVLLGAWLLHEPLEPRFVTGSLLVLTGVLLVSAQGMLRSLVRRVRRTL